MVNKAQVKPIKDEFWAKIMVTEGPSQKDIVCKIRAGYKVARFMKLAQLLRVSKQELCEITGIPKATFARREATGTLSIQESDRVERFYRLYHEALELANGHPDAAVEWLNARLPALGGETPLEYAGTEAGSRFVFQLLGRLKHGVFS